MSQHTPWPCETPSAGGVYKMPDFGCAVDSYNHSSWFVTHTVYGVWLWSGFVQPVFWTSGTGWRRPVGCLELRVSFRKRATTYRALLRKMNYKEKVSYGSLPPCADCSEKIWPETVIRMEIGVVTIANGQSSGNDWTPGLFLNAPFEKRRDHSGFWFPFRWPFRVSSGVIFPANELY